MNGIKKEYIQEVSLVRVAACLSIVLLHSIKFTVGFELAEGATSSDYILLTVAGILSFGTPAFVFISELLLSHSYPDNVPKNFYKKRVNLILIPFVCMAIFYAIISNYDNLSQLPFSVMLNLLGNYHGWFVLVIFQFYVLHQLFTKFLSKVSSKLILLVSLIINIAYLSIFNFIKPTSSNGFIVFLWDRGYWVPLFGWIFYFCLAYYCGRNYGDFLLAIKRSKIVISFFVFSSLALVIFINSFNVFGFGSKRVDMIPLTISLILLLFLLASKFNIRSKTLSLINNCSFGIYLIHYFYLMLYSKVIDFIAYIGYWKIPFLFITVLVSSIITVIITNIFPFGKFILGKSGKEKNKIIQIFPKSRDADV